MPTLQSQLTALKSLRSAGLQYELHAALLAMDTAMPPAALYELGGHWSSLGEHHRSLQYYDLCLSRGGANPGALLARSQSRMFVGDFAGCVADLHAALRLQPGMGIAWFCLARMRVHEARSERVAQLDSLLARARAVPAGRNDAVYLAFAKHLELDAAGDFAAAAAALRDACGLKRASLNYNPATNRAGFVRMAEWDAGLPAPPVPHTDPEWAPLFVLGMYRSGTTLVEQMLSVHPGVVGGGELPQLEMGMRRTAQFAAPTLHDAELLRRLAADPAAASAAGADYRHQVGWRRTEQQYVTDKMPRNHLLIGWILRALPEARIVVIERDPLEVAFSNLRELFGGTTNPHSYDIAELGAYYADYAQLMSVWQARYGERLISLRYEDLTADPVASMANLSAQLALDFDPRMADPRNSSRSVATASSVEVRSGVTRRERSKVADYLPYFPELEPALAAVRAMQSKVGA